MSECPFSSEQLCFPSLNCALSQCGEGESETEG